MKSIQSVVSSVPALRNALIDRDSVYTYRNLYDIKDKNTEAIQFLSGQNVVINGRSRIEFAILLFLLDGNARSILFLPTDIDNSLHQRYYDEANINFEVYLHDGILKYNVVNSVKCKENTLSTQWIIPTSGTTNIPKLVSHTFESLTRTAKINIEKGENFRWGLVFDIYRFSGIQVFLQSLLSGSTLIMTDPSQSMSDMLTLLAKNHTNALSATPSFWRKVLMTKESDMLNFERITLGGEIADNNILQALKQKYPKAKIVHIYASTEVGVGFSVSDGKEGFPVSYLNGELDSIEMKIDDNGLLWISPPDKNQKYLSDAPMYDTEGYINTGDLVKVSNDRVLFLGRESGAINVGGNKVQPEEVETVLMNSGLISAAYVFAMKNPMMGSLVCADVVLKDEIDKKEAKKILLSYCREHLEGFKVPAIVKFVNTIETTQSGKLKRQ